MTFVTLVTTEMIVTLVTTEMTFAMVWTQTLNSKNLCMTESKRITTDKIC